MVVHRLCILDFDPALPYGPTLVQQVDHHLLSNPWLAVTVPEDTISSWNDGTTSSIVLSIS